MITKIQTVEQIKSLFLEIFLNKTDKVSDISDNSILNATAFGVAKVAQKCLKDIALVESHIFPDSAYGQYLDNSATLFGATSRRTSPSGSSTFLRLVAEPGTQYVAGTHVFGNYNGIQFSIAANVTIGVLGWEYVQVNSIDTGSISNVEANSIISVTPEPSGHIGCVNEFMSTGGEDIETDEMFRLRIKKHLNIVSRGTIEYLIELIRGFNANILKVLNQGISETGKRQIALVFQNGSTLSNSDLGELLDDITPYLCLSDISVFDSNIGMELVNATWDYTDIEFRVQIASNYDVDSVRKQIQVNLTKYLDFRTWDYRNRVEWDDLLTIVKQTEGVKYVPDQYFSPRTDKTVSIYKLPRVRGFIMKNLNGDIISDNNNFVLPIYYPN